MMFMSRSEKKAHNISNTIAVDEKGRIWVGTFSRQLKEEEEAGVGRNFNMDTSGGMTVSAPSITGNTELKKIDAFELEIFDSEGQLLGRIPLDIFIDQVKIFGNKLYIIIDKLRGQQIHEYEIVEIQN